MAERTKHLLYPRQSTERGAILSQPDSRVRRTLRLGLCGLRRQATALALAPSARVDLGWTSIVFPY